MSEKQRISQRQAQKYLDAYCKSRGVSHKIGDYIGGGLLGTVFRVRDTKPANVVKIAQDQGENQYGKMCRRELENMRRLKGHPNIVELLDAMVLPVPVGGAVWGTQIWGNVYLLFMREYLCLQDFLRENRKLSEMELHRLAVDMCKALEHCEANSIIHRDVKPGNIFCSKNKDGSIVFMLGDFNASKVCADEMPGMMTAVGTDGFAAPEVRLSKADCDEKMHNKARLKPGVYNSDVYGLGITLYYLLKHTFPGLEYRQGLARRELPMLSEAFEQIIMKAVRFDPEKRYQSASQMRQALEQLMTSPETEVCRDNQFIWAKEALLSGKLEKAEQLAAQGLQQGEEACRLLLSYCKCIRLREKHAGGRPEQFWAAAKDTVADLFEQYEKHRNPMALFLAGLLCQKGGRSREFSGYMRKAADRGCIPAMFYWGKILLEEIFGETGRMPEGEALMLRAAEAEFKPALRYVKKYMMQAELNCSEALMQRLESVEVSEQSDMFDAIVRFL